MSAAEFLDAECVLWTERDDSTDEADACRPGEPGSTWRDWMMDFLATAHEMGEGFDGKRPNCGAGWQRHLEDSLDAHGTSFPEVLIAAFGVDSDLRPRPLLRPFGSQPKAFALLLRALRGDRGSLVDRIPPAADVPPEEVQAAIDLVRRALDKDKALRQGRAPDGPGETVSMDAIASARRCAVSSMEEAGGERTLDGEIWAKLRDYLDALVLRRHPTHSFLGMPLLW